MATLKPLRPLQFEGQNLYPLTTYDQIIMSNGKKWNGVVGTDVIIEPTITSGTKLATVSVDGVSKDLYYQASAVTLNGTAITSANFYAPITAGTAGQVLKSNGNGAPSWINQSAITAGAVPWSGITSKPSYYDAKAIKSITRSGTTFTYTCLDGSTGTFTQQDNNTTYSAGIGLSLSGTTFTNSGVHSIATGSSNGTISVNTNGTSANVAVKGLGSNAYTSTAYLPLTGGTMTGPLTISYYSNATMDGTTTNPRIVFADGGDTEPVFIAYTSRSAYRSPYGLKVIGVEGPAWFEVDGPIYANGGVIGNAETATKLATARTISLTGSVTGSGSFDGSGNLSIATTTNHTHNYLPLSGGTVTGTLILSNTTDADSTTNNKPALIIGGTDTTAHMEIDNNEILAKKDGITETQLNLGQTKGVYIHGPANFDSIISGTTTITSTSYWYQNRQVSQSGRIIFHRDANHATTITTDSEAYSHVLKANGSADVGRIYFNIPYASARTKVADGTIIDPYNSLPCFYFRTYSINSSTGARLSYYYDFKLPETPADLTANKTYYAMYQSSSGITSTTSKRYVMGISAANGSVGYNASVYTSGSVLYGACWNDYAEFRATVPNIKSGQVVVENGDGSLRLSTERLQPGCEIVSDTFGYAIGETDKCKTPIAVSGRVLAYPYEDRDTFIAGEAVCSGPNGTVSRMTREEVMTYPERIIGTVSEIPSYERWGSGDVEVNGRIWIKVK